MAVDSVDRAVKFKRFLRGQVPPERILLSHKQTELALHLVAPFPRNKAEYARITRRWVQQAREHFKHSSFPRAIRTEKPDKLAFLDLKRDLVCCARLIIPAPQQSFDRTPQPALFAVGAIDLRQFGSFNRWHKQAFAGEADSFPLQNIVETRQQMRDGLLRFIAHI